MRTSVPLHYSIATRKIVPHPKLKSWKSDSPSTSPCVFAPRLATSYRPNLNPSDRRTSLQTLHTTAQSSSSLTARGKARRYRGMRGRLRALTDSFGLTDPQESGPSIGETESEELYVMPGWAVAKLRDTSEKASDAGAASQQSPGA
jgi:hypothetical protein